MWNFPQYTFRKQAFSDFFWSSLEAARAKAGARAGVQASRMALKIRCKSFSEYLGILVAEAEDFGLKDPMSYLENFVSGDGEKSGGATERRSWRRQLRPRTEVTLVLIFF